MDTLPLELLWIVLEQPILEDAGGILRCVCRLWRIGVDQRFKYPRGVDPIEVVASPALLQWAWDSGMTNYADICLYAAGAERHFSTLVYAHAQGCPLTAEVMNEAGNSYPHNNHAFKTVQWLHEHGCPWDTDGACANSLEMLQWAHERGYPMGVGVYRTAVDNGGNMDVVVYAHKHDVPWDVSVSTLAAAYSSIDIVKWLITHDCPHNSMLCYNAARHGHFELLKWAVDYGCLYGTPTLLGAAAGGQLEIVKWLYETKNIVWHFQTCQHAARRHHLEVLRYARANGCPWGDRVWEFADPLRQTAQSNKAKEMSAWLLANGCPVSE